MRLLVAERGELMPAEGSKGVSGPPPRHGGALVVPYRPSAELAVAAAGFAEASLSESTRRAYASDVRQFRRWLAGYTEGEAADAAALERVVSVPVGPGTVVEYLTEKALVVTSAGEWRYAPSSMTRWLSAITRDHVEQGYSSPCAHPSVLAVVAGIRREHSRPRRQSAPLLLDGLRKAILATEVTSFPGGVHGTRDVAVLLLGFAGAFRRSELSALTVGDVTLHEEDGLHVRVRSSKTDQDGRGAVKGLPYGANSVTCSPCAFRRWYQVMTAAQKGRPEVMRVLRGQNLAVHVCRDVFPLTLPRVTPLFPVLSKGGFVKAKGTDTASFDPMSGSAIAHVIKRRARDAGLSAEGLSGHSLRAGFVTQAIRAGASHHQIMRQTFHKDPATVEIYVRENAPLVENAATMIGF
jgi:site-specific recombinase XerD